MNYDAAMNQQPQCKTANQTTGSMNAGVGYEPSDRWAHRSQKMRCETCMWFVVKFGGKPVDRLAELGRCRRHAPTMTGYPAVFSGDWCGDHKLDETK